MEGYICNIKFTSKTLTAKERVAIKDTTNAKPLATLCEDGPVVIEPDYWAELEIHNDHSKDSKDYRHFVIVDKGGNKFFTGSESFWSAFTSIMDEMDGSGEEFAIEVYALDSKNRTGKQFLTCSIV